MKRIKTQNIPAEIQAVSSNKTESIEVSGEDFKKALQSLVGEEVQEEQETTATTEPEVSVKDEDEEDVEVIEIPWNLPAVTILPDKMVIATNFTVEDPTQIELPQSSEQVTSEMISEIVVMTDQPVEIEEGLEQPIFNLPEKEPELVSDEPLVIQTSAPTVAKKLTSESDGKLTILENDLDIQEISLISEKLEMPDPVLMENQPKVLETEPVKMPTTLEEIMSQTELDVEIETKAEQVAAQPEEVGVSERTVNTDISASGQLTQMKLSVIQPQSQPQLQTETVKVVPQEQLVQEIETMIVENVEGTGQVDKVSTTRIQLTPKHLGELDIEIVMKNKELTARLVVEKVETKQWLEQMLTQLTSTLAEQDIKVEQFDIQVSSNHAGFTESSFNENPFFKEQKKSLSQRTSFHNKQEEEQVTERVERNVPSSTGRLSLWV